MRPLHPLPNRKVFGDSTEESTSTSKKLRITAQTNYRLMKRQAQQAGEGAGEQEHQVCAGDTCASHTGRP
jgi:hypothetical protein